MLLVDKKFNVFVDPVGMISEEGSMKIFMEVEVI